MAVVLTRLPAPALASPTSLPAPITPTLARPSVRRTTRLVPPTRPFSTSFRPLDQLPPLEPATGQVSRSTRLHSGQGDQGRGVACGRRAEDGLDLLVEGHDG